MVTPGGNGDDVEQKAEFLNETFIGVHMIVLLFPAGGYHSPYQQSKNSHQLHEVQCGYGGCNAERVEKNNIY